MYRLFLTHLYKLRKEKRMNSKRKILCLCAPSATGKSSIAHALEVRSNGRFRQAPSITTRPLRDQFESSRISVSKEEFARRKYAGDLLEAITFGDFEYGISKSVVNSILQDGCVAVIDCNIDGLCQLLKTDMNADVITVFLVCDADELYQRQLARQGNGLTNEAKLYRLHFSLIEIEGAWNPVFQYVLHNGDNNFDATVEKLVRILEGDPSVESDEFNVLAFKTRMLKLIDGLVKSQEEAL